MIVLNFFNPKLKKTKTAQLKVVRILHYIPINCDNTAVLPCKVGFFIESDGLILLVILFRNNWSWVVLVFNIMKTKRFQCLSDQLVWYYSLRSSPSHVLESL